MSADLKKQLKLYPTVINLAGKEELLKEEAVELILDIFCPDKDVRDFNVDYVSGKISRETKTLLAEEPVSSDFRVVFVDSDAAEEFLKYKTPSTVLVATGKNFSECQLEIDCKRLFGKKLRHWIRSESRRAKVSLDKIDIDHIATEAGGSLRKIRFDIFKLSMFATSFGTDVVQMACRSTINNTGWDIIKHIQTGNARDAVDTLERVKAAGVSPLQVISALQTYFTKLTVLSFGLKEGIQEFELERLEKMKARFTAADLREVMDALIKAEEAIKTGDKGFLDLKVVSFIARKAA